MRELEVLQAAYAETVRAVEQVTPDDLRRPTPCEDWDLRALLVHVVAGTDGLAALVQGQEPDWTRDSLGHDPVGAVRRATEAALAAWSAPGAVDRPSAQMPGMRIVDFAMADAVAHLWDVAAALGRSVRLDDELVQVVLDRWEGAPAEQGRVFAVFGPPVDVPPDAPALQRFLGLLGRDPAYGAGAQAPA